MGLMEYKQDGEVKRTSGSFFRGSNTNFYPSNNSFTRDDFVEKYVTSGWAPEQRFVTKDMPIVAFGSCFAANISKYLHARGYNVLTKRENRAYITQMGDGIVNTFAIRQQFEWAWRNKVPAADLWHGYSAEEFGYDETVRSDTRALFDQAELFIITLGLSEIWYDEVTGEVFWRAVPKDRYDPSRHKFRVSTHAETLENLRAIRAIIREFRPDAHILFSVSPIPLTATFRPVSCLTADAVSKAVLRSALDEMLRAEADDTRLHYMPSYEAVKRLFSNQWTVDRRHVYPHVLDFNMKLFEHFYCTPGIPAEDLQKSFERALAIDARIGMEGHAREGESYEEIRAAKVEARREARREARIQEREAVKLARRAEQRKLMREMHAAEVQPSAPAMTPMRARLLMARNYLALAAAAAAGFLLNGFGDLLAFDF